MITIQFVIDFCSFQRNLEIRETKSQILNLRFSLSQNLNLQKDKVPDPGMFTIICGSEISDPDPDPNFLNLNLDLDFGDFSDPDPDPTAASEIFQIREFRFASGSEFQIQIQIQSK